MFPPQTTLTGGGGRTTEKMRKKLKNPENFVRNMCLGCAKNTAKQTLKILILALAEASVFIHDPIPAHEHVGNGRCASGHAVVGPRREVGHSLRDSHHAVVDHLPGTTG